MDMDSDDSEPRCRSDGTELLGSSFSELPEPPPPLQIRQSGNNYSLRLPTFHIRFTNRPEAKYVLRIRMLGLRIRYAGEQRNSVLNVSLSFFANF